MLFIFWSFSTTIWPFSDRYYGRMMKQPNPKVERNQVVCRWRFKATSLAVKTSSFREKKTAQTTGGGDPKWQGHWFVTGCCKISNLWASQMRRSGIKIRALTWVVGRLMEEERERARGNVSGKEESGRRGYNGKCIGKFTKITFLSSIFVVLIKPY